MSKRLFLALAAWTSTWTVLGFVATAAKADDAADFYRGKSVSLYVGYPPGGGYDVYARVMAPYLGRHLPGGPSVIVRNLPGAASLVLVNQLYTTLPQDGTAIGIFARSVAMDRLLGREATNFDPVQFGWIGSANNEVSLCAVWHGLSIRSIEDFMTRSLVFGANAPGSESDVFPKILNELLGTKFKVATGYPAANDLMMAMERGETEGRCGFTWSAAKTAHADWIRDKKMYIAVQFASAKHPELPNVPLVTELARTPLEKQALGLILSQQTMGRPFAAPPNTPPVRLAALRQSFDLTMKDPSFLAEADKQRMEVQPVSGLELQELVARMFNSSPKTIAAARKAVGQK